MPPTVKPTPIPYVSPARENILRLNPNKKNIPVRQKLSQPVTPLIPPPQILLNDSTPTPVITPTNIYKPLITPTPTPVISPVLKDGPVDIPTTTTNKSILEKYPQIIAILPIALILIMIKK